MLDFRNALILGGAKCVFEDFQKAMMMHDFGIIIGINNIIEEIPEIEHAVTMHPVKMRIWLANRRKNGYPDPKRFWTAVDREVPVDIDVEFQRLKNTRGGSGLLAVYVARYLNAHVKVLCGIPMTPEGEHYHTNGNWKECHLYRKIWESNKTLKDDVRSFSGWTREQYGEPTLDCLLT